jgi:hypothetical protein
VHADANDSWLSSSAVRLQRAGVCKLKIDILSLKDKINTAQKTKIKLFETILFYFCFLVITKIKYNCKRNGASGNTTKNQKK